MAEQPLNALQRSLRPPLVALAYFTRIPIPAWVGYRDDDLDRAARWFPLIGIAVGCIVALVWWLGVHVFPLRVALGLSLVASVLLTGAFHEDGLADAIDGFGGGYTRERVLEIMHDSRIGSFGAIALILALWLKLEALAALPQAWIAPALVAAHAASRWLAVSLLCTLDYVRPEGKAKPVATRLGGAGLLIATVCGLLPLGLLPGWQAALLALPLLALLRIAVSRYLRQRIGGYTGDALGMTQQLAELLLYLGWLAWVHNAWRFI
ncbi:cobalamin-5'-phosphate synthase [Andreprevotia lacus DSM 23236]|jgi:adenosylcobinamide-GDP ribazoletransferase|uniref:Adenosylcobinamide-GDP ribazoletransferase n=1 Tax=Andreprevotia lacus DSM 23236 TaxID=1121001 RepID=A0A1W1XRV3_9NEIS|nr:adenosylcobinamide-GDP ribazoletransferase [Andreprevotia lacus]SMC26585.1 cobalamin-5'-phosphate synthase [Andreprevotia lacus DSM 23236]